MFPLAVIVLGYFSDFSQGIQNQAGFTALNATSRQGYYQYQPQPYYQFQYQPDIGGPWQNWGNQPSFGGPGPALNLMGPVQGPSPMGLGQGPNNMGPTQNSNPITQTSTPVGPLVGHGSATPVQFPGPVNNETLNYTVVHVHNNPNSDIYNRDKNQGVGVKIAGNCKCGVVQQSKTLERITGGKLSKDNAWPWMAAIVYIGSDAPFWFCGASLINDKYLITAAHCQKTIKRRGLANIRILMGTNGIPSAATASELYEITEMKTHPLYKQNIEEYDIGLIKLKEKVTYSNKISPICLTQRGTPFLDRMATVAGWGSIKYGDTPPDALREVEIKVVSNPSCQREYMYHYGTRITSAMLCAWLPGKDSCQGDSGGPLFLKTTSEPQVYTQIGVVSFGPPQCGETTIPGVYTRVASTIRWIKANTRDAIYCSGAF